MNLAPRITNLARRPRGFVLVLALFVIVLLTALLVRFNYAARVNLESSAGFLDSQQALQAARSGLQVALAALTRNPDPQANPLLANLLRGARLHLPDVACNLLLSPENGKLNVNRLTTPAGAIDRPAVERLLRLIDLYNSRRTGPALSYECVPALIDWTDPDDQPTVLPFVQQTNRGAESDYYQRLQPPYRCANQPLSHLNELLLVKGITSQAFLGPDRPAVVPPADSRFTALAAGPNTAPYPAPAPNGPFALRDCLTVYGDGRINLNAAPAPVLLALHQDLTPTAVQAILARRQQRPFAAAAELLNVPGVTADVAAALAGVLTIGAADPHYTVLAQGCAAGAAVTITAVIRLRTSGQPPQILWYQES